MKISKAQSILRIYTILLKDKVLDKEKLTKDLSLSDITWNRYLTEIRSYLENFDDCHELVYRRRDNRYALKDKNGR